MPRPIVSQIVKANPKCEREHVKQTRTRTRLLQDAREPTRRHDMSRHVTDMSHETYYHAG